MWYPLALAGCLYSPPQLWILLLLWGWMDAVCGMRCLVPVFGNTVAVVLVSIMFIVIIIIIGIIIIEMGMVSHVWCSVASAGSFDSLSRLWFLFLLWRLLGAVCGCHFLVPVLINTFIIDIIVLVLLLSLLLLVAQSGWVGTPHCGSALLFLSTRSADWITAAPCRCNYLVFIIIIIIICY